MKYLENEHYFETIDNFSKAYILGFIAADGALVKASNRDCYYLTITIKYEDKALLDFIQKELKSKHKLLEIRRISSFGKPIHHIRLAFANEHITKDIMKYGITPKKSLSLQNIIINIPFEFRDAFIIGYFDGNGSIIIHHHTPNSKSMHIEIRGPKAFLEGICNHLYIPTSFIRQYDSIPRLSITHKKYIVRFYKCYESLPFYYIRKHNKFLERINDPSYDKYKQDQTISSSVV